MSNVNLSWHTAGFVTVYCYMNIISQTWWCIRHGHGVSFTVEPWASKIENPCYVRRSCQARTWSKPCSLAALSCDRQTHTTVQKVNCHACCQHSTWIVFAVTLFQADLKYTLENMDIQSSWNISMRSFKIYGKWSFQTSIHTRVCNAVTLVWGLLRLTPTTVEFLCT